MPESHEAQAVRLLNEAALRSTPVRRAVLAMLVGSRQSFDVPGLMARLPEHTDAVTVYRTLNVLTGKKLVHRVRGEERSWRYAFGQPNGDGKHRHPHFVCEHCGTVECLTASQIPPTLARSLKVNASYMVAHTEVVVHGSCAKCH